MSKKLQETQEASVGVTFDGRVLRVKDLKDALLKYYHQECTHVVIGKNRQPDDTDYIPVTVYHSGSVEAWQIREVRSTAGGMIGVTDVFINPTGMTGEWVRYIAPAEQLVLVTSDYTVSVS